jgi:hypothetical protein
VETCKWIILTSEIPGDPKSEEFEEKEAAFSRNLEIVNMDIPIHTIGASTKIEKCEVTMEDVLLYNMMTKRNICLMKTQHRSHDLQMKVAKTFDIGLETTKRTLQATTQLALRHTLHPIH